MYGEASRRHLIGAGIAGVAGLFLAACGDDEDEGAGDPKAETTRNPDADKADSKIVNYALTLEYLESDFYDRVVGSGELRGRELELFKAFAEDERQHAETLASAARRLGVEDPEKPKTRFDDALSGGRKRILETALALENLGAAAYLGQAGNINDVDLARVAFSIHTVEGRHAGALARLTDRPISPDGAFAKPLAMEDVTREVKPYLAS